MFDDIVQISNYEVHISRSPSGYQVIVTNECGEEMASADEATIYVAMENCWQGLCG
jgi:hypothetical protein